MRGRERLPFDQIVERRSFTSDFAPLLVFEIRDNGVFFARRIAEVVAPRPDPRPILGCRANWLAPLAHG